MPCLHGRWPGQAFETIILASAAKGAPRCAGHGKAAWYLYTRIPAGPGRGGPCPHPTAKPLPLMRELVELVSKPGDLIVDPYAGSGTTGVACKTLGRRFIGWELDSGYAEVARRRLSGEEAKPSEAQPSLF
jgi:site-specific DNA-methyltransferase (adenine-specific)